MVTLNGEKIGIVGSTTFDLLTKTSPNGTVPKDDGNDATSDLQEVAALLQASVDALRATGINKITALGHGQRYNPDLASRHHGDQAGVFRLHWNKVDH